MLAWLASPCQPLVESVHSGQLSFLSFRYLHRHLDAHICV